MKFSFNLMGMEFFSFEFCAPSRGIYPVPDFIPSEFELDEFESEFSFIEDDEDD